MKQAEFNEFSEAMTSLSELYGKPLSPNAIRIYWMALEGYPLQTVTQAMNRHVRDPQAGKFMPKPADLIGQISASSASSASAHPGQDEAWAICVRMAGEDDTAIITEQMREAWAIAWPVIDIGDEVGARMAFREAYSRQVAMCQSTPKWEVNPGSDSRVRAMRVAEAVKLGRLPDAALVIHALPSPTTGVAGLLESAKVRLSVDEQRKLWAVIRQSLNPQTFPDEKSEERRKIRQEFESKRAEQLAQVALRLENVDEFS